MKELLKVLVKLNNLIVTLYLIITTETFCQGQKQIKERISAGILGVFFRYIKAYLNNKQLTNFAATILHIPCITEYSPDE